MKRMIQISLASIILLFCAQAAKASLYRPAAPPYQNPDGDIYSYTNLGDLAHGSTPSVSTGIFEGDSFYETWFEFSLTAAVSSVKLDTLGSLQAEQNSNFDWVTNDNPLDTILALYDYDGGLLGQTGDQDGGLDPGEPFENLEQLNTCYTPDVTSCLSFDNLPKGSYFAGVSIIENELFRPDWQRYMTKGGDYEDYLQGEIIMNIAVSDPAAVPLPATVWLFGSAMIGFIGMSRRRPVKT